jgi:hypothetical protein
MNERYVVQRNDYPTSQTNSNPWRVWDTQENRSVGWYPTWADAREVANELNAQEPTP